jgi:hypothetical protein
MEVRMSFRTRISSSLGIASLVVVVAAIAAGGASAGPRATASALHRCDISGQQRDLGASYVTSLKVDGTTCHTGKKVVRHFHACRINAGGANGKCHREVLGYSCSEHRFDAVPHVQYNSRVTCRKGGRRVKHTYTQNV